MNLFSRFWMVWNAVSQADKSRAASQPTFRPLREGDLNPATVGFVFLSAVADEDAFSAIHTITQAVEIAGDSTAILGFEASGVVAFIFGTHKVRHPSSSVDTPRALANALSDKLGSDVRILHGTAPGSLLAYDTRLPIHFTFFVPKFGDIIKHLLSLEPGSTAEWSSA